MTAVSVPSVQLNNGQLMPVIGLGTYLAKEGECEQAVKDAIDAGYRHIDTAFVYGNEHEVGNAVRSKIQEGVIKREEMFIVSKLGNSYHSPDIVRAACQKSIENLNLGPIDLYLMHTPMGYTFSNGYNESDLLAKPGSTTVANEIDYVDTWLAMESLQRDGLVRGLGVSNFNSEQLLRLLSAATIKPVTNQVECSANLSQTKLKQFCDERDIVLTAFAPLTRPHRNLSGRNTALTDPISLKLAEKYGKSPAQILLKFLVQIGTVPIPKSSNKGRLRENISIFDFQLSVDELADLDSLDTNHRTCPFTPDVHHKHFPFNIDY